MASNKKGLGRGLGALIPQGSPSPGLRKVHIDAIVPNPHQPRSVFDEEELVELSNSIRELGLIQPLIVQSIQSADAAAPPRYQLVTGERRWRASRLAGLQHVDVIVKDVTPQEMLEMALASGVFRRRGDLESLLDDEAFQTFSHDEEIAAILRAVLGGPDSQENSD